VIRERFRRGAPSSSRFTLHGFCGCRMLKKAVSKAAASEEARRTLRYVESLSDARTPLAGFFSVLLRASRLFLPFGKDPFHPHTDDHIRILHQRLDRFATSVIADCFECRRRR